MGKNTENARVLGDRKDFWNIPVNGITGYRVPAYSGIGDINRKVKEDFFKPDILDKWR